MTAGETVEILESLRADGVEARVGGGWGVDALLGEQTRSHEDLDLWVWAIQFDRMISVFTHMGIDRLYPWGDDRPWNFVVHDGGHRRVDLHLIEALPDGSIHYGSATAGETFPAAALEGTGTIEGHTVRCEAPEWSLRWHTGYHPRPVDWLDVQRLCERFGLELPIAFQ